ncbi:hypothetical protein [Deinococcus cellulosilyticus]|uniref:Uncharacterized protein n=1 Tax=Deinococcus cellulosilyticus (strain DSM 18568 / NBRC 106333 / KACC 11606 / 5516J-15) TaxID=1223518 RepID=A0A511N722_DEIC1|nr:hypothetical protein [Deinococcus cellulosilyticus]GEM48652.1 hypothetical protein DC3_42870 [Deinococcus cellulosilyticus NBRC 106333 = KACC 11606]
MQILAQSNAGILLKVQRTRGKHTIEKYVVCQLQPRDGVTQHTNPITGQQAYRPEDLECSGITEHTWRS